MNGVGSRNRGSNGNSLIEFALILPILILLIVNTINFAGFLYAWIAVTNASRVGAQYIVMAGATVSAPSQAPLSTVVDIVKADLHALPNSNVAGVVAVKVCTTSCSSGAGAAGADPEPAPYESYYQASSVDVSYTYKPFISSWRFTSLGISATLFPNAAADGSITIHRQAFMRVLQ